MTRPRTSNIKTWQKFGRVVRSKGCKLLSELDNFPNSILVTGCQRSGTTMLSRIITRSEGMVNYWFGRDDELDAALILSGEVEVEHEPNGRYCFQTTYLNECVNEYFEHGCGHKVIWVLRNPFSVVHSMLYNWRRFALNELFIACGADLLNEPEQKLFNRFGLLGIRRLKRACLSYCGKVTQLFLLSEKLGKDQLIVLDYDVLVSKKEIVLPVLYRFIDLAYQTHYADMIHGNSLSKHDSLSRKEFELIESACMPVYEKASRLAT